MRRGTALNFAMNELGLTPPHAQAHSSDQHLIAVLAVVLCLVTVVAGIVFFVLRCQNQRQFDMPLVSDAQGKQTCELSGSHKSDETVTWTQLAIFPILLLLVMFSVPSMTFGLYKPALERVLDISAASAGDIASFGLVGGMVLGFVPGIIYDRFGYVVTLMVGGAMATIGAFMWYVELRKGGEKGQGWLRLAVWCGVYNFGCRTQYFAGACVVLGTYPKRLIGTFMACIALSISVGYILLPMFWKSFLLPDVTDKEAFPDGKNLATLKPVAGLHLMLAAIYLAITIAGLSITPMIPSKPVATSSAASWSDRIHIMKQPTALSLFLFVILTMGFVYTFMVNGVAPVAHAAGAGAAQRGIVIRNMGIIGMLGRLLHGFGADMLRSHTPAKQAGTYVAYLSAVSWTCFGFVLISYNIENQESLQHVWSYATYAVAFGFGGIFSLFPASARTIFGVQEVGFWLGILFALSGMLNFGYSRLGAVLAWGPAYFTISSTGTLLTLLMFGNRLVHAWGKE